MRFTTRQIATLHYLLDEPLEQDEARTRAEFSQSLIDELIGHYRQAPNFLQALAFSNDT